MNSIARLHATICLLGAAIFLTSSTASAGVLYGVEYQTVHGRSGHPGSSAAKIGRDGFLGAYCFNGTEAADRRTIYPLDIPNGYEIFSVTVWGDDSSPGNDLEASLIETCQPFLSAGAPTTSVIDTASTAGSAGRFALFLFAGQYLVDANSCAYYVEARFADATAACGGIDLAVDNVQVVTNNPDVIFRDNFED